ncbi:hypothetical protein SAMN04244572_02428 [Azotobacter beijerinckii]|uniref:Uncharacterized protein n=1 Tax=Azotobacter beijerinckii TaxID=170623 RepID=A0A1I4HLK0_9GAMM|nr:hypothetical protein [Azotobacter beijerinckii]SEJ00945.1 hypothetical protein SAMN04244572_02428 [Azotobacter beijerinckii]SEJ18313.1 hypothetical protein SAMN04244579_03410 [Azotobacter beijerinckii]SER31761.1 hypothetical protein SAMN04244573_03367 [Azotobacter beijerinckii]SFB61858.1 hypothetical protein SAMN04244571_04346 [Azotobacter beijerinckii]SFL42296.1 hypothetical protein SAMN04244574_04262 [Azotobacter beijerinckii]
MMLKDLAARSASFNMRLHSLQGISMLDWGRMKIPEEDRPALLRQMHRDSVVWLYGYIAALADRKFVDRGDAERMQCELLYLHEKHSSVANS